jgi:hypothetical protein
MKKILLLLIFLLSVKSIPAQWTLCPGTAGDNIVEIVNVNNTLFAGVNNNIFHGKILKSTDNGLNWDSVNTGFDFSAVFDMAAKGNTICVGTYEDGLVWSTDAGNNWQINSINGVQFNGVFAVGMSGNNIITYHNTAPPNSTDIFYFSSNNGVSWNPLPSQPLFEPFVFEDYDSVFIAGHKHGISVSTDHGLNWTTPMNTGLPAYPDGRKEVYSLIMNNGTIYAGCITGFAYSTNMGENWTSINLGFPNFCNFKDLLIYNNLIFGGVGNLSSSSLTGVYKSLNFGLNWTMINNGLPSDNSVSSLFISNGNLLAGTSSEGIYKIPLSVVTPVTFSGNEIAIGFSLSQNYPNPFNSMTRIEFSVPVDSRISGNDNVVLEVFDLLGREVAELVNGNLQPGNYAVTFDASGLSSGIYFYKLKAGEYSDVKKMLYIR